MKTLKRTRPPAHKDVSLNPLSRKGVARAKRVTGYAKRWILITIFLAIIISLFAFNPSTVLRAAPDDSAVEELSRNIDESLKNIDFGELDDITQNLGDFNLFGGDSFAIKVGKILSGEFHNDYPNLFVALLALAGGVIADVLPMVVLVVAIAILAGFMQSVKPQSGSEGVQSVIHFVTYAAVIVLVLAVSANLVAGVGKTLSGMKAQMDIIFPILLTLMATVGSAVSVSVYQPAVVMLSAGVMQIFTAVVLPLFIITLAFSVVGNLSQNARLDRFVNLFSGIFKWTVGIVFTIFLAFLTIQGISAAAHDGISIRAAKLTVSSYVPYLGGYLSQGFDLVLASSVLIKNAVGVAGLYLLLSAVVLPIIKIAAFKLGLLLASAVTQPIADEKISHFLQSVNKAFSMLVATLAGAAFMYFLTIGLVISTGNIF